MVPHTSKQQFILVNTQDQPGNPYGKERLSTVDLLVLTSSDRLL